MARGAKAGRIPCDACLGGQVAATAKRLWARMYSLHSMDALPAVFGPYASLGPLQEVPNGMPDPYDWIESMLQ